MSKQLKAARIRMGLSQNLLARKAGISRNTIANMERGKLIREDNLLKICRVLGVKPEEVQDMRIYNAMRDHPRWRHVS